MDHPSDPVLERLTRLHPKLIDLTLDRVRRLLGKLGAPHLSLPPVVHVAGTNAKGSVIAMMRAALEAADYKVHVHTSPHLVRFNERIRLAGKLIEDDALIALLEECEQENGGDPITFMRRHHERIRYLHLKSVESEIQNVLQSILVTKP